MSKVWMCADLHLNHSNISRYRDWCGDRNEEMIADMWNDTVRKRDIVYMLGDIIFEKKSVHILGKLPGTKVLICGNHDDMPSVMYGIKWEIIGNPLGISRVHGFQTYKRAWLSHAPIHPQSLRGRINIHGHIHEDVDLGREYINASADVLYQRTGNIFFDFGDFKEKHFNKELNKWEI